MQEGGYRFHKSPEHIATPKVSIVTVCYNADDFLQDCIDSVHMQDTQEIEHVIIDGESRDKTVAILKANEGKISYWRSEKDSGIYHAMNKALNHVRGKWILFLGADDGLLPDFSKMLGNLKKPDTLYYSKVLYDTIPTGGEINGYFLAKNNICHQSILYPQAVFDKYRFEERYVLYADHYLNMQCWSDPDFNFEYCDLLTARFSTVGVSSKKKDILFNKDKIRLIKKHFGYLAYVRYLFKEFKSYFKKKG